MDAWQFGYSYRIVKNITSTILIAVEEGLVPVGVRIILCQLGHVSPLRKASYLWGARIILSQLGDVSPLRKASYLWGARIILSQLAMCRRCRRPRTGGGRGLSFVSWVVCRR